MNTANPQTIIEEEKIENKLPSPIDPMDVVEDYEKETKIWYTESTLKGLMKEYFAFIRADEFVIKRQEFLVTKAINRERWKHWANKYPWFKEMDQQAMDLLGNRREKGMVFKNMAERPNLQVMHFYDPDWCGINEYHANLKAAADAAEGNTKFVYVPGMTVASTGLVPPNKKKGKNVRINTEGVEGREVE